MGLIENNYNVSDLLGDRTQQQWYNKEYNQPAKLWKFIIMP